MGTRFRRPCRRLPKQGAFPYAIYITNLRYGRLPSLAPPERTGLRVCPICGVKTHTENYNIYFNSLFCEVKRKNTLSIFFYLKIYFFISKNNIERIFNIKNQKFLQNRVFIFLSYYFLSLSVCYLSVIPKLN